MLVVKTSRVSTVKAIFGLTVALVALYGFAIMPAYEWAVSVAQGRSDAPAQHAVATTRS